MVVDMVRNGIEIVCTCSIVYCSIYVPDGRWYSVVENRDNLNEVSGRLTFFFLLLIYILYLSP